VSRYHVTVAGRRFSVELPARMTFSQPASDAQATEAIAGEVARQLEAHLPAVPASRELIRDDEGQLVGSREYPAASPAQVADEVGRRIARLHLGLD
jgi:hypothetical protein